MALEVFAAVLFAAFLHALWNALVKGSSDKLTGTLAVIVGTVPPALICLVLVGMPATASLTHALISGCVHTAYMSSLVLAYRHGDLSHVYPLARGTAPLIVTVVSVLWLDSVLTMPEIVAILTIALGILSLATTHTDSARQGTGYALSTAGCIAIYTLIDGAGVRLSGSAMGYFSLVTLVNLLTFLPIALYRSPGRLQMVLRQHRAPVLVGGSASFAAYCIVLWCFTQAPVPLVSALRETGIIFALVIGVVLFREPLNWRKGIATFLTLSGSIMLRFGRH